MVYKAKSSKGIKMLFKLSITRWDIVSIFGFNNSAKLSEEMFKKQSPDVLSFIWLLSDDGLLSDSLGYFWGFFDVDAKIALIFSRVLSYALSENNST